MGGFCYERATEDELGGSIIYIIWTCILARSNSLKLKHLNDGFASDKHAAFHFTRH